jgi:hypothetical protein
MVCDRKRDFGIAEFNRRIKERISNNEYRMSNIEGRNAVYFNTTMRNKTSLRLSSVRFSRDSAVCCSTQMPIAKAASGWAET